MGYGGDGGSAQITLQQFFEDITQYGAKNIDATGNAGFDSTTAIDNAIAKGKPLYIPAGRYIYGGAQASYVFCIGDGTIINNTNNNVVKWFTRTFGNTSQLISGENSYVGIVNERYTLDNATRVYILPKAAITSGVGGVLKIFGDNYHDNQNDYRDFGLYFSANQNSDVGTKSEGVFWINSKAIGVYADKNPDIGFSFQDGNAVAGRFAYFGSNRTALIIGGSLPQVADAATTVGLEMQKDIGFLAGKMIRWEDSGGNATSGLRFNSDNTMDILISGTIVAKVNAAQAGQLKLNGVIAGGDRVVSDNNHILTPDKMCLTISHTVATTIDTISAAPTGTEITLVFGNGNTTVASNTTIRLQGAANFVGSVYDVLKLVYTGNTWYEVCRSVN